MSFRLNKKKPIKVSFRIYRQLRITTKSRPLKNLRANRKIKKTLRRLKLQILYRNRFHSLIKIKQNKINNSWGNNPKL